MKAVDIMLSELSKKYSEAKSRLTYAGMEDSDAHHHLMRLNKKLHAKIQETYQADTKLEVGTRVQEFG